MGAGFSRLNWLTIVQTSQGLAEYLLNEEPGAAEAGIVVGHDARHNSLLFAQYASQVFNSRGIRVWWYDELVHTPLVPFGVRFFGAAAGVMITASHNPAQDNGYKVYGSNGCQINSPADSRIASAILQNLEPTIPIAPVPSNFKSSALLHVKQKYLETVSKRVIGVQPELTSPPSFVYTPMHGVGLDYLKAILEQTGISKWMTTVEQQAQPHPDFPTVKYPNPEELGALDLAKATADENSICLVLANDPDADRFAAAERTANGWYQFTGDQLGVLLAYYLFTELPPASRQNIVMLISAVSSQMLPVVASKEGFYVVETLTGFKWLGNVARDLHNEGKQVHFAYEEALGYMVPEVVLDKDGILAAAIFLSACVKWGSPWGMLQHLYDRYGHFETMNTYWRTPDVDTSNATFTKLRALDKPFPATLGGRKILRWRDLTLGFDSSTPNHVPSLPCSSSSQMITCWLSGSLHDDGVRFTIRASGTEPKIKSKSSDFY
jgi:phosphoglucomutase